MNTPIKLSVWALTACGAWALGPVAFGGQSGKPGPDQRSASPRAVTTPAATVRIAWSTPKDKSASGGPKFYDHDLRDISITGGSSIDRQVCLLMKIASSDVEKTFANDFEIFFSRTNLHGAISQSELMLALAAGSGHTWPAGPYDVTLALYATTDNGSKRGDCISNTLTDKLNRSSTGMPFPGDARVLKKMILEPDGNITLLY